MTNNLNYITLILTLCTLLTACSDHDVAVDAPDSGKTPIEVSVGGADTPSFTRTVVTDGTGKTLRAFTGETRLFFAMVAEDGSNNKKYGFNYGTATAINNPAVNSKSQITFSSNYLYWDDAYARDSKVSVYSIAVANKVRGKVELTDNGNIAIGTESPGNAIIPFTTNDPGTPIFKWQIGKPFNSEYIQDKEIFEWADLVFSNNIANYSSGGGTDNRLKFHTEAGDKYHKFDQGELIYYHALTQFTIKIKCGEGFKADGNDFQFTNAAGVSCTTPDNSFGLNGFYGADGVFFIGSGEFQTLTTLNVRNYASIYKVSETSQKATAGEYYVLKAYVFPGTDMTGSIDNAFSFIIDGNKYDVSLAKLLNALKDGTTNGNANVLSAILKDSKYLQAGYNYEFTFTVGKNKIENITAQVAEWETVTADEISPSNARIKLQLEERGVTLAENSVFSLYRKTIENSGATIDDAYGDNRYDWTTGFTGDGSTTTSTYVPAVDENGTTPAVPAHWKTEWYWPNNKTFYHIRALGKATTTGSQVSMTQFGNISEDQTGDFASLSSNTDTYDDVCWGAPFTDDAENETSESFKIEYDKDKGFDVMRSTNIHQLYHAIGPTSNAIKLIFFHMMSEVKFTITTNAELSADYIEFGDGTSTFTKFELVGFQKDGKVLIGSGKVEATGVASTDESPFAISDKVCKTTSYCTLGAVPQDLTNVMLIITTPDNNRYEVSLKDLVSTVTDNELKNPYTETATNSHMYKIDRWYPGFKYNYTFKLTKKGIESITATIVNWEEVTVPEQGVQIQ